MKYALYCLYYKAYIKARPGPVPTTSSQRRRCCAICFAVAAGILGANSLQANAWFPTRTMTSPMTSSPLISTEVQPLGALKLWNFIAPRTAERLTYLLASSDVRTSGVTRTQTLDRKAS